MVGTPVFDVRGGFASMVGIAWEHDRGQYDEAADVFGASGAALAYRRAMLNVVGMFDERFFMYCEDVDLAFRAQLAGYRCVYAPRAVVRHRLSASSDGVLASYFCGRNFIWLLARDLPTAAFDLIVTDEFLTVIKAADKPLIVKRWKELLTPGGTLVTTAMVGGPTTPELRQGYAERARHLLDHHADSFPQHQNGGRDNLLQLFDRFATVHTRHMLSGEAELRQLFDGFGKVSWQSIITPGECVNPTESFQIVASVP